MRLEGISVNAAALWLPDPVSTAEDAVADGTMDPADLPLSPADSVHLADRPCWEMGLVAAREALTAAGIDPLELDHAAYAPFTLTEEDPWSPVHRIARLLGARDAVSVALQQMSNGGTAALLHAATQLMLEPYARYALVLAASDFTGLAFPRWSTAPDVVYGDGAAAVIIGRGPGALALRALATRADAELEATFPRSHPFRPSSDQAPGSGAGADFLANAQAIRRAVADAVADALADAGLDADDPRISLVLPTRLGRLVHRQCVDPALPEPLRRRALILGDATGHLGAGDALANLATVANGDLLAPGDLALLVTTGAGFTASCVVVERTPVAPVDATSAAART